MIAFTVNDMTCGHCVGTITRAIAAVDEGAKVTVDLAAHRVAIEPRAASAEALGEAIADAGYTPVPVASAAPGA
jgi:copper chaperone